MIPYYVTDYQYCEHCNSEIYINYECVKHDDGFFCDKECLTEHLYEGSGAKEIYLTDDRMYREVD